jgi:hypothetical protein
MLSGDNIRSDFKLKGYDKISRIKIGFMYSRFFKRILNQKVNIIFAGIVLIKKVRDYNRNNIQNYFEIYIKSNINYHYYLLKYNHILNFIFTHFTIKIIYIRIKNLLKLELKFSKIFNIYIYI